MRTKAGRKPARTATWLAVMFVSVAARGAEFRDRGTEVGADGVITRANLGPDEPWPLRIEQAKFVCTGDAVFLADGSTEYPLNGAAQALTRKEPKGRRPLTEIWVVDDKTLGDMKAAGVKVETVRKDIGPILTRGEKWCRSRR